MDPCLPRVRLLSEPQYTREYTHTLGHFKYVWPTQESTFGMPLKMTLSTARPVRRHKRDYNFLSYNHTRGNTVSEYYYMMQTSLNMEKNIGAQLYTRI